MKDEHMLQSMELLDEQYVKEARPGAGKARRRWAIWGTVAACVVLLLSSVGFWLFMPFPSGAPDVSAYSDSPYYPLIQQLNQLTYVRPTQKNRFEQLLSQSMDKLNHTDSEGMLSGDAPNMDGEGALEGTGATGTAPSYQETTDNQVAGVMEGDRIKRSDRYIYYLDGKTLNVYTIDQEQSEKVGSYTITPPADASSFHHNMEFYLSQDCRTVTVIQPTYHKKERTGVSVVFLDVSDPGNIQELRRVGITGDYKTSRITKGKLLLISEFFVGRSPDFSEEANFLPQVDTGDGPYSLPLESIITPETLTSSRYTVICMMDTTTGELLDCSAFLSYTGTIYVSAQAIYATRDYSAQASSAPQMTDITRLSYTGGEFQHTGTATVEGSVKDQYSMDEYNGMLRVVTTVQQPATNASLYVVDLTTMETVSSVEAFAPKGESVRSVRFDKDCAYVCTAIQLSDPVFFFDLSDPHHITYKETGTIEGFSTSLVNFGNGFLLGIGVGDQFNTVKIEVYEETENGVRSVSAYEVPNASYAEQYKAYLIDREKGLVGLGICRTDGSSDPRRYLLLHFDTYQLRVVADIPLQGLPVYQRAVVIDGYLYAFGEHDFTVAALTY